MKYFKKLVVMILMLLCVVIPMKVEAKKIDAKPQMVDILLNDEPDRASVYNINGDNYLQLSDLAQLLVNESSKFNFNLDKKSKVIEIIPKQKYVFGYYTYRDKKNTPKKISNNSTKLLINGKTHNLKTYLIDGNTYFKLNDLASLLGFEVGYDQKAKKVNITTEPIPGVHQLGKLAWGVNLKSSNHPSWADQVKDFVFENNGGTISLLEVEDEIVITTYDSNYKKLASKKVKRELQKFGVFYSGEKYNYISYGATNTEESNKEVIRIVKYDKNFNRISAASIKGHDITTTIPFNASSGGRMAEYGDILAYHTSRERYTSEDGKNHQSQLTIEIDTNTMQVINELSPFQWNHVSHSFDQYVTMDGDATVYLDHGDAYPRSLVLHKKTIDGENEVLSFFDISGKRGANVTGVSIGGFEQSSSHYLVAFNSINQNNNYEYTSFDLVNGDADKRNVYVYAITKDFSYSNQQMTKTVIANYEKTKLYTTTPTLVKVTDDKFVVLWQEYSKDLIMGDFKYVYVNGLGEMTSPVRTLPDFKLSNVQPIVKDNKIIWFAKDGKRKVIYEIDVQ
ncbi:hypothetical protein [Solibacillus sp. CAU 1738]|uniref:hypothetical protein n=1 Tax=Solibacillus sp. CAU 1738 TaxID=3140363 RepID=UPI003261C806